MKTTTRVSLDLTPAEKAELTRLVKLRKARTGANLLRKALRFYAMCADHLEDGYSLQAIKGGRLYQFPDLDVPYPKLVERK